MNPQDIILKSKNWKDFKKRLSKLDTKGQGDCFEVLTKADLFEAGLQGAYLRGADMSDAFLFETILWNADLRGANLTWGHSNAELGGAKYNKSTKFHVGSHPEAWGMVLVE